MSWLDDQNPQNLNSHSDKPDTDSSAASAEAEKKESSTVVPPSAENGGNGWQTNNSSYMHNTNSSFSAPSSSSSYGSQSTSGEYHYAYPERNGQTQNTQPEAPQTPPTQTPPTQMPPSYQSQGGYNPYGWQQYQPPQPPKGPKKKKSSTGIILGVIGVVCAAVIVTLSVMLAMALNGETPSLPNESTGSSVTSNNNNTGDGPKLQVNEDGENADDLTTKEIIKSNLDSTVVINMYENYTQGGFGATQSMLKKVSAATGIVMTEDGFIITNAHCVINEETGKKYARVDVKLYNGKIYEDAKVIGADSDTDLAVIKIEPKTKLKTAVFGKSSEMELGDRVIALGNAGGLEWTPTQGILSGLARDVYADTGYAIKCLQTDAAINPGNSGGPLINSKGQVIGINSAKIAATGYESLGFSIPIEEAKTIIDSLIQHGYVQGRVALGVTVSPVAFADVTGLRIASISQDSNLNKTAAQVGDIITAVNGKAITDYSTLRGELAKHKVGEKIQLTLLRMNNMEAKTFNVSCTLMEDKG